MNEVLFDTQLQCIINYMCNLIVQYEYYTTPLPCIDYVKIRETFNTKLLNKSQRMFYKYYRECSTYYKEKILKNFNNKKQIEQYNRYSVAILLLDYIAIYEKQIVYQFFKIITQYH